jgi:transcriptional regulator with XRE-family HTH domain
VKTRRRPRPGTSTTPTYPDLATYLADTGDTQAHVAARVGTTQAHISRIAAGDVVPRILLAVRIAEYCSIPLESFARVHLAKRAREVA